jgi:hypothetical protein
MTDLNAHWRALYANNFVGHWDFFNPKTGRYQEVTARIDRVTDDEVTGEGGRKTKPLQLWLSGRKGPIGRPLILSKTNGTTLQLMFGPQPKDWIGKEIVLYVRKSKRVRAGTGDVVTIRNTRATSQLREELETVVAPAIPEDELQDPGGPDAETH